MVKNKKTIIIWGISIALLVSIIYIVPSISGIFTSKGTLEKGTMTLSEELAVYIVRDEVVYGAPFTGTVEQISEEGNLEKKGTQIIDMEATEEPTEENRSTKYDEIVEDLGDNIVVMDNLTNQMKGIVSYYVDGNEGKLTLETIFDITWKDMEEMITSPVDLTRDSAQKGDPVYKIADNASWMMIFWTDITADNVYEVGDRITVDFGDDDVRASVIEVEYEGTQQRVILETNRYYANFAQYREVDATIELSSKTGLIVSKSAIATVDGQTGVFVITSSGSYTFVPVYVKMEQGEEVLLVEGTYYDSDGSPVETVVSYQEVLTNESEIAERVKILEESIEAEEEAEEEAE